MKFIINSNSKSEKLVNLKAGEIFKDLVDNKYYLKTDEVDLDLNDISAVRLCDGVLLMFRDEAEVIPIKDVQIIINE